MTTDFATFVEERFAGKLQHGSHTPNGAACFMEAINAYRELSWSDKGNGTISLIALNDAPWSSDEARTEAMVPLGPLVLAWPSWTKERQQAWAKLVTEGVIRRILPPTLRAVAERVPSRAPELVAAALRCETEGSARSARSAAESAESAAESAAARSAAWSAAESAESAAESAKLAARSARSAESAELAAESAESAAESAAARSARSAESADHPLQELCRIMLEAEETTRG